MNSAADPDVDGGAPVQAAGRPPATLEDETEEWCERLREVAEAARQHGFTVVVAVTAYDPLSNRSMLSWGYRGHYYAALGAADTVCDALRSSGDEDDD